MNKKLIFRMSLDLIMTILILLAIAFRVTGDIAHEWIGIAVYVLFIIHNVLNKHWYGQLFKRRNKYSFNYILNTIINLLLIIAMSVILVTGMLQSKYVLGFLDLSGSMLTREIHSTAAYWGYILVSIHLGMHWSLISKQMFRKLLVGNHKILWSSFLFLVGIAIFLGGIYAFIERDMYSKLFLGMSFDFWDKSALLFILYHILIMGLFVWLTHYALKVIYFRKKQK